MANWDQTVDVVVVGSGGGGMTAAIVAAQAGLDTLIVEKTEAYGGSTALSGGGMWIPNNYLLKRDGVDDSIAKARLYMANTVGDRTPQSLQDAYLENAPKMVEYLASNTSSMRFQRSIGYADYYPERPGGMAEGRALEAVPFDGSKLGDDLSKLNTGGMEIPFGLAFTISEFNKLGMIIPTWKGKWTAFKVGARTILNLFTGVKLLTIGGALIGRLRYALKEENIPLWLNTPLKELVIEDGKVVGVVVERNGQPIRIQASKGVVLAAGGFAHNQQMRDEFQKAPIKHEWSSANKGNTGDAIQLGMAAGAKIDLMEDAWWGPTSMMPGMGPMFHVGERSYPGSIMVNGAGKRFTNEAASYVDVGHAMYENDTEAVSHIPATFIMDQRYRNKYIFGTMFPGQPIPQNYYDTGYIKKADTLEELAVKCGLPPQALVETVKQFNEYARTGVDEDFGRGNSAYDRYYGDPTVKPNPCLAPINKPPYYAVQMIPGDLGTKGGLVIDEYARVIQGDGTPFEGLYAAGNNSASVMGNTYPGPGSTIGPSMTFGYIAAKHIAEGNIRSIGALPVPDKGLTSRQQLTIGGAVLATLAALMFWRSRD
ncbi:FAD-binding protein [Phototrophicus methaneseepsis]|uniref:3-oxosteroid 1-dehydrogenase n=1 Tax=Phototrophicus methaneseepsis TaxID=2710758 RepID=A0A7S8ICP8_9CHLR|nr:FAD-binding protein [Phototrophicus methaneseepsis]QPC80534.1 FAD-binding protein [Phototrophicus methaneseepsis]